jgi:hypothetical protein
MDRKTQTCFLAISEGKIRKFTFNGRLINVFNYRTSNLLLKGELLGSGFGFLT